MTIRDDWDAGSPQTPAGFAAWGENASDAVDNTARLSGDQSVAGIKTFASSPRSVNPADNDTTALATVGEVRDRIAAEPSLLRAETLIAGAMNPPGPLSVVSNTTAENPLSAVVSVDRPVQYTTARVALGGTFVNDTGSPVTYTVRLRNFTDTITIGQAVFTLAGDEGATQRPFLVVFDLGANLGLNLGTYTSATGWVAPLGADPRQDFVGRTLVGNVAGQTTPQQWLGTIQMGTAHADAQVRPAVANILYTTPAP